MVDISKKRIFVIGKKAGMLTFFDNDGNAVPATVIETYGIKCFEVKNKEAFSECAVGFFPADKEKRISKPQIGRFKKLGAPNFTKESVIFCQEGGMEKKDYENEDIFKEGDLVNVKASIKGRGFSGAMKRHGFKGLGRTHGVSRSHRSVGSIGTRRKPTKVWKNKKMPGRWFGSVTIQNLQVLQISSNMIIVKGSVPGHNNSFCRIKTNLTSLTSNNENKNN